MNKKITVSVFVALLVSFGAYFYINQKTSQTNKAHFSINAINDSLLLKVKSF